MSMDSSRGKWISSIQINGKTRHLGRFDDEQEAARAYDVAAKELHGEFARLNFPEPRMFIFLVPGSEFKVSRAPLLGIFPAGTDIRYHSHIDMKTADGMIVPWLASQTDILAEDWGVVP